jgi:hypothetical protein
VIEDSDSDEERADPSNPKIVCAGTEHGVFKSTNGNQS